MMFSSAINKINFFARGLYFNNLNFIILFIFLTRISYAGLNNNIIQDTLFYKNISDGIIAGCGFSMISDQGECFPIVGHFFPFYFYLLSIFYALNLKVKSVVIFISTLQFISFLYLYFNLKKYLNKNIAKFSLIWLSLSPLSLGYTRVAVIEPVLIIFSILFLAIFVEIYFEGFKFKNCFALISVQVLGIYFKPTMFLLSIPFIVLAICKLNLRSLIKILFSWFLIILISIFPWGYRNIAQGANYPIVSAFDSNFFPENTKGYINWLSTWVITEHEHANNGFPIWLLKTGEPGFPKEKSPFKVELKKAKYNPFISTSELKKVQDILDNIKSFSNADNKNFQQLAKERRKDLGFIGNTALNSSRIISLLLNPLNSWGWPLEIYSEISTNSNCLWKNQKLFNHKISCEKQIFRFNIFFKLILKIFVFLYRLFIFISFINIVFGKFILRKDFLIKPRSFSDILITASLFIFIANIYLIGIVFSVTEHRLISTYIPWIEFCILINFLQQKYNITLTNVRNY